METFLRALNGICSRLADADLDWALAGSFGLAVRGIPFEPHDIDLITDRRGAYDMERIFSDFAKGPVVHRATRNVQSYLGVLDMGGIKVEIMGDLQLRGPNGRWEDPPDIPTLREFVEVNGLKVPVLSLKWEHHAYETLGRKEKALAIKERMKV